MALSGNDRPGSLDRGTADRAAVTRAGRAAGPSFSGFKGGSVTMSSSGAERNWRMISASMSALEKFSCLADEAPEVVFFRSEAGRAAAGFVTGATISTVFDARDFSGLVARCGVALAAVGGSVGAVTGASDGVVGAGVALAALGAGVAALGAWVAALGAGVAALGA